MLSFMSTNESKIITDEHFISQLRGLDPTLLKGGGVCTAERGRSNNITAEREGTEIGMKKYYEGMELIKIK